MPDDWLEDYRATDDPNERYRLLRAAMRGLRQEVIDAIVQTGGTASDPNEFNDAAFRALLHELDGGVDGDLLVFAANDFGNPLAFLPEGGDAALLEDVHEELLTVKYNDDQELNAIRERILDYDDRIHKVLVAVHEGDRVRYHAPAPRRDDTNFLTVRQMAALVDWTANSDWDTDAAREDLPDNAAFEPKEVYTY